MSIYLKENDPCRMTNTKDSCNCCDFKLESYRNGLFCYGNVHVRAKKIRQRQLISRFHPPFALAVDTEMPNVNLIMRSIAPCSY